MPNFHVAHQPNNTSSSELISRIQQTPVGNLQTSSPFVSCPTSGSTSSTSNFGSRSDPQRILHGTQSAGLQTSSNGHAQQHSDAQQPPRVHHAHAQPSTSVSHALIGAGNCDPSTLFDNATMTDDVDVDEDFDREHMSELSFMMSNLCQVDQKAANTRSGFMPYIY